MGIAKFSENASGKCMWERLEMSEPFNATEHDRCVTMSSPTPVIVDPGGRGGLRLRPQRFMKGRCSVFGASTHAVDFGPFFVFGVGAVRQDFELVMLWDVQPRDISSKQAPDEMSSRHLAFVRSWVVCVGTSSA